MTEKAVKLKVKSVQNTGVEEEESEITELLTDAVLSVSDERISLGYDEIVSDDGDVCSTSLVFDKTKPGTVFLPQGRYHDELRDRRKDEISLFV